MSDFGPVEWITMQEAAELMGISADYFRKTIRRGRFKAIKRGRDWFLVKEDILAYHQKMQPLGSTKHNPTQGKTTTGRNNPPRLFCRHAILSFFSSGWPTALPRRQCTVTNWLVALPE